MTIFRAYAADLAIFLTIFELDVRFPVLTRCIVAKVNKLMARVDGGNVSVERSIHAVASPVNSRSMSTCSTSILSGTTKTPFATPIR